MSELSTEPIIQAYFDQENILAKHQLESFDDYIENILPNILKQYSPINVELDNHTENDISIKNIKLHLLIDTITIEDCLYSENNGVKNILYPDIANRRNYSYMSNILIDICVEIEIIDKNNNTTKLPNKILNNIIIGTIPIMVGSKYCMTTKYKKSLKCKYDIGGYFIINGNEKVVISQEKIAPNLVQVFESKKDKFLLNAEIRSLHENIFGIPKCTSIKITNNLDIYNNELYINVPNINNNIPVFIIFRLLGCINDKEILYNIIDNSIPEIDEIMTNILLPSFEKSIDIKNELDAYRYLISNMNIYQNITEEKKIEYINKNVINNILPHITDRNTKVLYLGYMINKLLKCLLKIDNLSDRDNYIHKRIETPGVLIGNITYLCYNKIFKDSIGLLKNETTKKFLNNDNIKNFNDIINYNNIYKIIKPIYLESTIKSSLATGNWGIKNNISNNKSGVSQVLNRLTYSSGLSHLRRVSTSGDVTGKLIPPRKLHSSSWGYICPSETPEGQAIGLVKNLSNTCEITHQFDSKIVKSYIMDDITKITDINIYEYDKIKNTKIFINGDWLGYSNDYKSLIIKLKNYRKQCIINIYTSIYMDYKNNILYIHTDRGRCIRPLLKINKNKLLYDKNIINKLKKNNLKWHDLCIETKKNKCIIEYVDIYEVNNILLCNKLNELKYKKYNNCEISPSLILGLLASCIPFANHNQAPRNTYQSAMGKQAIGVNTTNINDRYDTFTHMLHYPQKSIISTKYMKYFNTDKLPNGINIVVAIMSYTGYNQEDSVLINRGAIERGLFNSTYYRTYREEENKNQLTGEEDIFCKPDTNKILFPKNSNYDKLSENGFVPENTYVDDNDIIIGKIIPTKHNTYKYKDTSISMKNNDSGYIDKNYIDTNGDGFKFCKVRIRNTKIPEMGDKFSSRHGQKGTVGMILEQCDMPFTKDGIVPDIIINPHAIPSRMTIAQLLECLLGKTCTMYGYNGDSTAFIDKNISNISNILEDIGFEGKSNEVMYSGINGEQLHTSIFIGPTYYQRLKHMSSDKIHSRASGPIVSMTRQPSEGRSSYGGLRFGEMERDCMISHGASNFLQERFMKVSDKFICYICNECNMTCVNIPCNSDYYCKNCNNYLNFTKINIPYSCKLLFQELQSMSIVPRYIV
jgi:DNA-directed RNA polymerase II subunit RPB2